MVHSGDAIITVKERRRTEKSRKSLFCIFGMGVEVMDWMGIDECMIIVLILLVWDKLTVCKMYVIYSLLIEYYHEQKLSRQSKTMVSQGLQSHQKATEIASLH